MLQIAGLAKALLALFISSQLKLDGNQIYRQSVF